jgi:hypothetical protein
MAKNTSLLVAISPPAEDIMPQEYVPPAKPPKDAWKRYAGLTPNFDDINAVLSRITRIMSEYLPRRHALEAGRPDPSNGNWQYNDYKVSELKVILVKLAEYVPVLMSEFVKPRPKPREEVEED